VLESPVRSARIHEVRKRELVDVPKALKRKRVNDTTLVPIKPDEHVDGVAELVEELWHVTRAVGGDDRTLRAAQGWPESLGLAGTMTQFTV
jgi:hypothetical protein